MTGPDTPDTPDTQADERDAGGTQWDAPNQQTVREDQSGPWEEGTGGQPGEGTAETAADQRAADEPAADTADQPAEQADEQADEQPAEQPPPARARKPREPKPEPDQGE